MLCGNCRLCWEFTESEQHGYSICPIGMVFTPSDFAFPSNGIKAEATPNTEMTLIVDVDLDLLKQLHEYGTVRILKDRRHDLYNIKKLK
jgi:predicted amidohydrolase